MKVFNYEKMKEFIQISRTKQKGIAEKAGISEATLSQILSGKTRCEAGVYMSICETLRANPKAFVKEV